MKRPQLRFLEIKSILLHISVGVHEQTTDGLPPSIETKPDAGIQVVGSAFFQIIAGGIVVHVRARRWEFLSRIHTR